MSSVGALAQSKIAVVGSGLGGAFVAALLQAHGLDVQVFEQAAVLERLGAGIHLSPNYVRLLMRLGLYEQLTSIGAAPEAFVSRSLRDDSLLNRLPLGKTAWTKYGAPYLTVHRGDLHAALVAQIRPGTLHLNKRLVQLREDSEGVHLSFGDGTLERFDAVIGADGLKSRTRQVLYGPEPPTFGGHVAFRASVPADRLSDLNHYSLCKWWSDDRFVISYFLSERRDVVYFAVGVPQPHWPHDKPWVPATTHQLQDALGDVTPRVAQLAEGAEQVSLWPLYQRPPIDQWGNGKIVLLGDACHPMQPHMAQGAAMATEDGALLARFLVSSGLAKVEDAFAAYANFRIPRTREIVALSNANRWLREPTDADWVYGYDAMTCSLRAPTRAD